MHFSSSRTRRLLLSALLAVFCSISAPVVRAELTVADIQTAVYAALTTAPLNLTGNQISTVPWMFPGYSSQSIGEWILYNIGVASGSGGTFFDRLSRFEDYAIAITNSLSRSGVTNVDYSAVLSDMTAYLANLQKLDGFSFRADDALRVYNPDFHFTAAGDLLVHDPVLETVVDELKNEVRIGASSIEEGINESNTQLMTLWQQLQDLNGSLFDWYEDWKRQRDYEASADEASVSAYHNAENEGYNAKSDDERDGTQLYEEAELPKVEDHYTPSIEENSLGGSDLGLQDVEDDVSHSAVITMVHGDASPGGGASIRSVRSLGILPRIEWDMGSDPELVNFVSRIGTFMAWLSSTLALLLLSYKGLHMWRVVRIGFVQAATGNEPTLQLAYDPF